ncbi:Putative aminoacrylate hydrolase RutD [Alphaproteobacteria bacterium SO-S41]|nr:Putative aminoacrylate hydrolase RutD [Alphaproteobacteria bacterium SO-S41]
MIRALFGCIFAVLMIGASAAAPTRFSVAVSGAGPDVVLLPGLGSAPHVFDAILPELEKTHRVHRIQIAGFAGLAAGPNATGEVIGPVRDELIAYIHEAGLTKPALIGHSMGGLTALLVAIKEPDLLGKAMVIDALPFFSLLFNPAATSEMAKPFADQFKAQMLGMDDAAFAALQTRAMANLSKSPKGQAIGAADSIASDRAVLAEAGAEAMVTDARGELSTITIPVTVLQAYDAMMPVQKAPYNELWATAYTGLTGVKLQVIEGSYHFIMYDQPEKFAAAVTAFLAQ